jgi:hypothetical protein
MAWIKNEPIPPVTRGRIEPNQIFRKLYRPLGAVALVFADLEAQLTRTITALLGTSRREGIALEWLMQNLNNRIELFYFLAMQAAEVFPLPQDPTASQTQRNEATKTLQSSAVALFGELTQANSDRNNLLHGAWTGFRLPISHIPRIALWRAAAN